MTYFLCKIFQIFFKCWARTQDLCLLWEYSVTELCPHLFLCIPESKFNTNSKHLKCFKKIKLMIWKFSYLYSVGPLVHRVIFFPKTMHCSVLESPVQFWRLCRVSVQTVIIWRPYFEMLCKFFHRIDLYFYRANLAFHKSVLLRTWCALIILAKFYKHSNPLWNHVSVSRKVNWIFVS